MFTSVHSHIPNGQPGEDLRDEKRPTRVSVESADKSAKCPARGKLNGEVAGHADFREVGEDVRVDVAVGVGVGPMKFKLIASTPFSPTASHHFYSTRHKNRHQ